MEYTGLFIEDVPEERIKELTRNAMIRINNLLDKQYIDQVPDLRRNLELMKDGGHKADIWYNVDDFNLGACRCVSS